MTTMTVERRGLLHNIIDRLPDYKAAVVFDLANVLEDEPPLTDDELAQLAEADDPTNGNITLSELLEEHLSRP